MALSEDLISSFVKVTKDDTETKKESTVLGTVVKQGNKEYVKLDGSELLTPVNSTTVVQNGDRVSVLIKDHSATITGNISSPAARGEDLDKVEEELEQTGSKITEFEIVIADKVSVKEFDAVKGRVDNLTSDNVTIKEQLTANKAEIDSLTADNVVIKEQLTAQDADIENLKTTKLDAEIADIKYATIESLEATDIKVNNLEGNYAEFKEVTTDKFAANEASIKKLETEKLSSTEADLKYANIDFGNIGEAAIKKLFTDSGIIKDLIVSEGHITGELVGVTIKGDLIEGGTVKADKLVVKGSDGLYYKLNMTGEKVEALQTDENSLSGSVITAKSITATKISVDDLVAFDATIGGFNITTDSIYSGVKDSIDNTTNGLYLGKDGQISIGDGNNFIKYFKDINGNYKLAISAKSIVMGGSTTDLETALSETIKSSKEEFYQSDSPTSLVGGSWSSAQPTWTEGKYIWRRNVVTYADESIEYSPSENGVCITGNTGTDGEDSILLQILSSNGSIFKNSTLSTTLTVTIMVGGVSICSSREMYEKFGQNAKILWEQKRFGEESFTKLDPADSRLSDNGFILTLSTTDVYTQTTFNCLLDY